MDSIRRLGAMRFLPCVFVFALCGCAGRGHIAPSSTVITGASLSSRDMPDAGWPTEQWWRTFNDPQLDTLVDLAVAGSPSIRIALDRLRIAQAESAAARSGLLPKLDAAADLDREKVSKAYIFPPPLGGGIGWNNVASLDFSYDLDLWGKAHRQWESALAEDEAIRLDARQSQLTLTTAVVRTYVQLSLAFAVRDVAVATVHQRQTALDITRRRLSAGITSQLEVSEAASQLSPTLVLVEQADASIQTLQNQLVALLGREPADAPVITRPALTLVDDPPLPAVIPADLVGRRPDIVAARWRVMSAGKKIDVANAQFYPDINLTAMAGLQSISMATFLTGDALTFAAGPAIRLPIFEGGKLRANLEGRTGEYDLAVDRYNEGVINAMRDVANDVVAVRSSQKQGQLARVAVADAQRAHDQATLGFKAGITDFLNVLATQNVLLAQQQNLARIVASGLDANAQLAQALGGGFRDDTHSDAAFAQALDEHPAIPPSESATFPSLKVHEH